MWWRFVLVGVVMAAGCTKPNPRSCKDGICNDPAFPFCDVDGALGGEPQECIAVTCEAQTFETCREDSELRCNATGNNYDTKQCELGCNAASDGCRLCKPNQTACTNGSIVTCDANGIVVASTKCTLGCFEDQPRCRESAPSNNLGQYLDMVASPPDLDLSNPTIVVDTGEVRVGTQMVTVPNFFVPPTGNAPGLRIFVANSLELTSATFTATGDDRNPPHAAVAFVVRGDIRISGELRVASRVGGAVGGCIAAGNGAYVDNDDRSHASGGGGGANGTDGADGGAVTNVIAGGVKDMASGTSALIPLRGGCPGGFADNVGFGSYHNGGGAIQLSSGTAIEVDATIDVRGAVGNIERLGQTNGLIIGGGGAGGSILLEAPRVNLGANAKLLATGGNGTQGCANPSTYCGAGGAGATLTGPATKGADVPFVSAANVHVTAGGGGGGLGRIRINTADATYTKANTAVEAAIVTSGVLKTR